MADMDEMAGQGRRANTEYEARTGQGRLVGTFWGMRMATKMQDGCRMQEKE